MSHALLDLDRGNLKSCKARLSTHVLQDEKWNLLLKLLETPPVNYVSVVILSRSEMILSHQLLCGGKKWSCSRWNTKAAWGDPHGISRYRQKHCRLPWSLERGLELGEEGNSPTLPCISSLEGSCPYSSKWVCSVVLQWAEKPSIFFVWSSHKLKTPPKYYFVLLFSGARGCIIVNYFLPCTHASFVANGKKKNQNKPFTYNQASLKGLTDWHSSHKSFVRVIEQFWRRRSYLELFCLVQLILLNDYPLNTLLASFIHLFLSGTCIIFLGHSLISDHINCYKWTSTKIHGSNIA